MPEVIFDTTVLSNFAAVGRVDLLDARYRGKAFTTVEVISELRKGINAGYSYLEPMIEQRGSSPCRTRVALFLRLPAFPLGIAKASTSCYNEFAIQDDGIRRQPAMRMKELIEDMGRLERELHRFETKFGVKSSDFHTAMTRGELEEFDALDDYRMEFVEWSALYKTWLSLDEKYHQLISREPVALQIKTNIDLSYA